MSDTKPKFSDLPLTPDTNHGLKPINETPEELVLEPRPVPRQERAVPQPPPVLKAAPTPAPVLEARPTPTPIRRAVYRETEVPAPKRAPSRGMIVLGFLGVVFGVWTMAFRGYLRPLSEPGTERPDFTRGLDSPVYQVPGPGNQCLVELESVPTGSLVRVNRFWTGGVTPTVLGLPCNQSALITLTTPQGQVSHEAFKPSRALETQKVRVSNSPFFRAATWLLVVADFHARLLGRP